MTESNIDQIRDALVTDVSVAQRRVLAVLLRELAIMLASLRRAVDSGIPRSQLIAALRHAVAEQQDVAFEVIPDLNARLVNARMADSELRQRLPIASDAHFYPNVDAGVLEVAAALAVLSEPTAAIENAAAQSIDDLLSRR